MRIVELESVSSAREQQLMDSNEEVFRRVVDNDS